MAKKVHNQLLSNIEKVKKTTYHRQLFLILCLFLTCVCHQILKRSDSRARLGEGGGDLGWTYKCPFFKVRFSAEKKKTKTKQNKTNKQKKKTLLPTVMIGGWVGGKKIAKDLRP